MGLRVEPAALGSGIEFRLDVEPRLIPLYVYKTTEAMVAQMEAYVREALEEGLAGWQVTDCRVTMWDCGYASPVSTPADFRRLTQLVLATALDRAGTWVCEPLADVALELPSASAPGTSRRWAGSAAGSAASSRRTACRWSTPCCPSRGCATPAPAARAVRGRASSRRVRRLPASAATPRRRGRGRPSPLDRDAWLASLSRTRLTQ